MVSFLTYSTAQTGHFHFAPRTMGYPGKQGETFLSRDTGLGRNCKRPNVKVRASWAMSVCLLVIGRSGTQTNASQSSYLGRAEFFPSLSSSELQLRNPLTSQSYHYTLIGMLHRRRDQCGTSVLRSGHRAFLHQARFTTPPFEQMAERAQRSSCGIGDAAHSRDELSEPAPECARQLTVGDRALSQETARPAEPTSRNLRA